VSIGNPPVMTGPIAFALATTVDDMVVPTYPEFRPRAEARRSEGSVLRTTTSLVKLHPVTSRAAGEHHTRNRAGVMPCSLAPGG